MPKLNTTVKAVRIDNDKLEELEKRLAGRSINSWMNEQIVRYLENPSQNSGAKEPDCDMTEIEEMAICFGMTGEEMIHGLVESLNEGSVTVENGRVKGYTPWVEMFEDACHDLCIDVEKAASGAIKALRDGR